MWQWINLSLFGAVMGIAGAAGALDLKRSVPSHMTKPPPGTILDRLPNRGSLPYDKTGQIILREIQESFDEAATYEAEASKACRRRNLGQREPRRYAVAFPDRVITGGPKQTLVDIEGVTEETKIYLFVKGSTTRCTVYSVLLN